MIGDAHLDNGPGIVLGFPQCRAPSPARPRGTLGLVNGCHFRLGNTVRTRDFYIVKVKEANLPSSSTACDSTQAAARQEGPRSRPRPFFSRARDGDVGARQRAEPLPRLARARPGPGRGDGNRSLPGLVALSPLGHLSSARWMLISRQGLISSLLL